MGPPVMQRCEDGETLDWSEIPEEAGSLQKFGFGVWGLGFGV